MYTHTTHSDGHVVRVNFFFFIIIIANFVVFIHFFFFYKTEINNIEIIVEMEFFVFQFGSTNSIIHSKYI